MLQQQKHTVKIAAGMLPTAKTYCELLLVLCAAYKGRDFALVTPYLVNSTCTTLSTQTP